MDADSRRAHPQSQLRPRPKEAVNREKMYKRQITKDVYRAEMAKEVRRQLALMNKCRMHKRGNGVVNQPFYTKFQ